MSFVPKAFNPPLEVRTDDFVVRKLTFKDAEKDYEAVMSSRDLIHKIRGGSWPEENLTLEDDLIDLGWHQREFEYKRSFAYTVFDPTNSKCLGCVYFYPTNVPWANVPSGSDALVNMWVTQEAYDKGLYLKLFKFVKDWVEKDWPFKNPHYSNREIPEPD